MSFHLISALPINYFIVDSDFINHEIEREFANLTSDFQKHFHRLNYYSQPKEALTY